MKIRLIVPNRSGLTLDGCTFDVQPIETYGKAIANIASGFTATLATGGWVDGDGRLIVEPVTVFDCVYSSNATLTENVVVGFRSLAKTIAGDLRQECIYLEIDGVVEYVKG